MSNQKETWTLAAVNIDGDEGPQQLRLVVNSDIVDGDYLGPAAVNWGERCDDYGGANVESLCSYINSKFEPEVVAMPLNVFEQYYGRPVYGARKFYKQTKGKEQ